MSCRRFRTAGRPVFRPRAGISGSSRFLLWPQPPAAEAAAEEEAVVVAVVAAVGIRSPACPRLFRRPVICRLIPVAPETKVVAAAGAGAGAAALAASAVVGTLVRT